MIEFIFFILISLIPASVFGAYATLLFVIVKKVHRGELLLLPFLLFPFLYYLFAAREWELPYIVLIGYVVLFLIFTTYAVSAVLPPILIGKFGGIGEQDIFVTSTLSFAIVYLHGFAKTMSSGSGTGFGFSIFVVGSYAICAELALVSAFVCIVLLTLRSLIKKG